MKLLALMPILILSFLGIVSYWIGLLVGSNEATQIGMNCFILAIWADVIRRLSDPKSNSTRN